MSQNPEESTSNNQPAEQAPERTPESDAQPPAKKAAAKKAAAKRAPRKSAASANESPAPGADAGGTDAAAVVSAEGAAPAKKAAAKKSPAKKAAKKTAPAAESADAAPGAEEALAKPKKKAAAKPKKAVEAAPTDLLFQVPEATGVATSSTEGTDEAAPAKKTTARKSPAKKTAAAKAADAGSEAPAGEKADEGATSDKPAKKATAKKAATGGNKGQNGKGQGNKAQAEDKNKSEESSEGATDGNDSGEGGEGGEGTGPRRRRRRGGRRRGRKPGSGEGGESESESDDDTDSRGESEDNDNSTDDSGDNSEGGSRRRRTRNRAPKNPEDEIASVHGSTRLEAKKQRRREGREAGRRRAPIVSEAEFLARREAVDRVMVVRQREDLTQIGVLEDKVLVEHYVSRASQTSMIGNVYLGRVQNVLPSMEAAFVDIGKGRNAVIYAGEVNWSALGHKDGQPRKIESVLTSGQTILVQVTKDPIGHKGARLTGQVSLPGRFLVYVPDGTTSGISRKLPDTERNRLKTLLKQIVPDTAGVIVRTAAEGASEEELTQDVERLTARWNDIEAKVKIGQSPQLLYGEPDLTLKVVRDLFTEDFSKLIIQGDDAWSLVNGYVSDVAPDLRERLEKYENDTDIFASFRVDEQIAKGLDRKVWLPSGGSLIIDRTEAMTVIDVNTGKFTGSGGNLEETVTKNNLEAAEEIVRQLRLRDIGGIIVVDFIDMVLESNRDLVLRRVVECLGRDRTRHQVAEVTSLGLVQMTRKRIGTGLVEAFSEPCSQCHGRGVVVHDHPVETAGAAATEDEPRRGRNRGGRNRNQNQKDAAPATPPAPPSPKDLAASRPTVDTEDAGTSNDADRSAETGQASTSQRSGDEGREGGGRSRNNNRNRPAGDRSGTADTTEATEPVVVAEEPTAPATTVEVDQPVEATAAPAPVVVTTTRRRRSASRPAGPPATVTAAPPASEPAPEAAPEPQVAAAAEPVQEPVLDAAVEAVGVPATTETVAEEVVETTPEAGVGDSVDGIDELDEYADADLETDEQGFVLHVPVKKKGSRKR